MSSVIVLDQMPLILKPVVSGGNIVLSVHRAGAAPVDVPVPVGDDVQDDIDATVEEVEKVEVQVHDDGTYLMYVVGATQWARNTTGAVPYSHHTMDVPAVQDATEEVTVEIQARTTPTATPTATRSQKIIIRRHINP